MEKQNIYGYCRISTKNQNEDRQVEAMRQYNIEEENIFIDKKSGATFAERENALKIMYLLLSLLID